MIEGLMVLLGAFLGGFCANMIVGYYHLSGFLVWVVWILCILFGIGIMGVIYEKFKKYKYRVVGIIVGFILGSLAVGFFNISSGVGVFFTYIFIVGGCFEYAKEFDKKGRLVSEENNDYQGDQLFLGISLVAKMTKIDGRVSSQEAECVSGLLDMICEHYGGDQKIRETCKNVFNSAKDDNKTIYQYAKKYQQVSNHEECEAIYEDLWVIAMADGELHSIEQETLRNVLGYLRLDSGLYEKYFHKILLLSKQ